MLTISHEKKDKSSSTLKIKDIHQEIRQEHKLNESFLLGWNEAIKSFQLNANQRLHRAFSDDLEIQKYINEIAKDLIK